MPSKRTSKDKKIQRNIARERIKRLFSLAEQYALLNQLDLADRYVEIARKISMRHLVQIPQAYKRRFCKHCYSYFFPYVTCRVRIHRGRLIMFCFRCRKFTRIPLK